MTATVFTRAKNGAALPLSRVPRGSCRIKPAGRRPVKGKIHSYKLRRAGITAMAGTLALLGVDAPHVIFGHTHCAGPLPWMDQAEWRVNGTTALMNTGCWTEEPAIDTTDRSPYRPGYGVLVEEDVAIPPRLVRITEHLGEMPAHAF